MVVVVVVVGWVVLEVALLTEEEEEEDEEEEEEEEEEVDDVLLSLPPLPLLRTQLHGTKTSVPPMKSATRMAFGSHVLIFLPSAVSKCVAHFRSSLIDNSVTLLPSIFVTEARINVCGSNQL